MALRVPLTNAAGLGRRVASDIGGAAADVVTGRPKIEVESTSYGPPWGGINGRGITADGTDLRQNPEVYGIAADPAVFPMGTRLFIWPNPFNHKGAFKVFDTGGAIKGNRIDFYDWRGRAYQTRWGRRKATVSTGDDVIPGRGGISVDIPNPLDPIKDAGEGFLRLVKVLLSPKLLGRLVARVWGWWLRFLLRAIWDIFLAPPWHWTQRAAVHYSDNTLQEGGPAAVGAKSMATIGFWAVGWAILYGRFEESAGIAPEIRHVPLAKVIRSGENKIAARRITAPKDVEKNTATKPSPRISTVEVGTMRRVSASRRRAVTVSGRNENTPTEAPRQANAADKSVT